MSDEAPVNLYFRLVLLRLGLRRRGRLSLWDTARTPFRVALTDLDVLRHMNNGKYLSILDLGRMDLMLRAGFWETITGRGWYPVVAGQSVTYRKSLTLGQRFTLETRVLGFDDRWVYMEQRFVGGDVLYADAIVRARFLKRGGGSVGHDELEAAVGGFPPDRRVPSWVLDWNAASSTHGKSAS
ncbi:acyl-CoA thioesterase [Microbacterium sp. NPDC077663]|uniref:acyl-CoA thioesterase n=1 Tax=Microbacterium sp. NPDC077663 TaxID=3364189 RepID=UPI0037C6CA98